MRHYCCAGSRPGVVHMWPLEAAGPATGQGDLCHLVAASQAVLLAPATCMHATPAGGETLFSTQLAHLAAVNACP